MDILLWREEILKVLMKSESMVHIKYSSKGKNTTLQTFWYSDVSYQSIDEQFAEDLKEKNISSNLFPECPPT